MILVTVTGNVTKDAESKNVGSEGVTKFGLASNAKVKGEKITTFLDCDIWGKRGAALAQYIKKGQPVTVVGELTTREYNGKTYLGVRVDHIELQGKGSGGSSGGRSNSSHEEPPDNGGSGGDDDLPF